MYRSSDDEDKLMKTLYYIYKTKLINSNLSKGLDKILYEQFENCELNNTVF